MVLETSATSPPSDSLVCLSELPDKTLFLTDKADAGHSVTFLLRSPSVFDADEKIQAHVASAKALLVKGDALVKDDVKHVWEEAVSHGNGAVDLLLFSVGMPPSHSPIPVLTSLFLDCLGGLPAGFNLFKGFLISPPNLCTQSLLNVVCTIPTTIAPPRLVTISSMGLGATSHAALPFVLRFFYGLFLHAVHEDKLGSERVVAHCAGWDWDVADYGEPHDNIMGPGNWKEREGLPVPGSLKNAVVVRPALLTNGKCAADNIQDGQKGPYRVSAEELRGAWTISRRDTAHFVVDLAVNRWEEFQGKRVTIAY